MAIIVADSLAHIEAAIKDAVAQKQPLEILSAGTRRAYGEVVQTDHQLSLAQLSGVIDYEPAELILTAHAGTPLSEILNLLEDNNQMLAFEPPALQPHFGASGQGTLGGLLATGLSGPRRIAAGAVRDYLLGFNAVSGRGDIFKSGSKVMKNVTGYDLSKLMVGSFGTLAVMDEVTLKTLPKPETSRSVLVSASSLSEARVFLKDCFGSSVEPSGGAILPAAYLGTMIGDGASYGAVLRLEGVAESVADRFESAAALTRLPVQALEDADSRQLWHAIATANWFEAKGAIWRASVAPEHGPAVVEALRQKMDVDFYLDWAGGLIWLASEATDLGPALRAEIGASEGHASCITGPKTTHGAPVFQPVNSVLAALNDRVKHAFDPLSLLNPGKMTPAWGRQDAD